MPRHVLKLLSLLTVFAVAPAPAGNHARILPATASAESACPHERARIAAALLWQGQAEQAKKVPTRVTLVEPVRTERPFRNVAPGAYFTP